MPTPRPLQLSKQDYWQFSLSRYARAGVQPACLALQNDYQGNVNLALLLHWLDTQHISLADPKINALVTGLRSSNTRLQQYRTMRKQLKPQLDQAGYQQLLAFELELEKSQQHDLIEQLNHFTYPSPEPATNGNLVRYCQQLGASTLLPQLQALP